MFPALQSVKTVKRLSQSPEYSSKDIYHKTTSAILEKDKNLSSICKCSVKAVYVSRGLKCVYSALQFN